MRRPSFLRLRGPALRRTRPFRDSAESRLRLLRAVDSARFTNPLARHSPRIDSVARITDSPPSVLFLPVSHQLIQFEFGPDEVGSEVV